MATTVNKSAGAGTIGGGGGAIGGRNGTASGGAAGTAKAGAGGSAGTAGEAETLPSILPCPGATTTLTVAADGSGKYSSVQAAINAVAKNNSQLVQVKIKAGRYHEQVTIDKPFVCLVGEDPKTTVITNAAGTNVMTGGTVIVGGNDFSAAHITFENSASDGAGQAVALLAQGQRQQFFNCRFVSYQDTLYALQGTQYFRNCYIQGNTDYIFGGSTAVFDRCILNNIAEGTAITAPNTPLGSAYGFVIIGGSLTADPTTSRVRDNHVFLGRAWGPFAAAAYINVTMGAHIAENGWSIMPPNSLSLAQTHFCEYKSTGAGANTTNANRSSRQLSDADVANYTVEKVLSPWSPGYSE